MVVFHLSHMVLYGSVCDDGETVQFFPATRTPRRPGEGGAVVVDDAGYMLLGHGRGPAGAYWQYDFSALIP